MEYRYEEDLKIQIWKTTLIEFLFFLLLRFLLVRLKSSYIPKFNLVAGLILEIIVDNKNNPTSRSPRKLIFGLQLVFNLTRRNIERKNSKYCEVVFHILFKVFFIAISKIKRVRRQIFSM